MGRVDNAAFYDASIRQYGISAQGVQWRSRVSQEIRFDQLLELLPLDAIEIMDVGCGFGHLYHYLPMRNKEHLSYRGVDVLEKMVKIARERTRQRIDQCDVLEDELESAEFYVCSGALNILTRYEAHRFIQRCYQASQRGFVFNFLEGEDTSHMYNYLLASDVEALGYFLGACMEWRRGYFENDCTVAFYKEAV